MKKNKKTTHEDLGLGEKVIEENRTRFLNRDGSFNVHKKGMFERGNFSPYHGILNASWTKFNFGVILYYVFANLLFTFLYLATGKESFPDIAHHSTFHRAVELFFYSVQVITTLGSSPLSPVGLYAHIVLGIEAMVGMLGFAVGASLMFARFSNPANKILFSKNAVVAPFEGGLGFMVRMINGRNNQLVDVEAVLTLIMDDKNGKRQIVQLELERSSVPVFPLNWTIVHIIEDNSPIKNLSLSDLEKRHAEFLVGLKGVDEDLSKTVYARMSYLYNEIKFGYKFKSIIERDSEGTVIVDPKRISEMEQV